MITVTLSPPSTLRLSFAYDPAVNERLKSIGAAWVSKAWILPVVKLDALIREFDTDLAIEPNVFMVAPDRTPIMNFCDLLHQAGISLDVNLKGYGGAYCEDPWQRLIDARRDALIALGYGRVDSQINRNAAPVTRHGDESGATGNPAITMDDPHLTDFDRTAAKFEGDWIKNAQRKAEMIERRRAAWQRP